MRPRLDMVRLALGPVSLSLVLAVGSCGSAVPAMAYADDALELVEDGETLETVEDDSESIGDDVVEPETEQVEPEVEPEPETEQVEPEPEPETEQVEPEVEPEPEQVEAESEPEQVEDVSEGVDITPVVDLLMLCAGSLGVLVGYHAFSSFWRVLGGEQ